MPAATYNSKVIFNGDVLMDLTGDTVTADKLLTGAHRPRERRCAHHWHL